MRAVLLFGLVVVLALVGEQHWRCVENNVPSKRACGNLDACLCNVPSVRLAWWRKACTAQHRFFCWVIHGLDGAGDGDTKLLGSVFSCKKAYSYSTFDLALHLLSGITISECL